MIPRILLRINFYIIKGKTSFCSQNYTIISEKKLDYTGNEQISQQKQIT